MPVKMDKYKFNSDNLEFEEDRKGFLWWIKKSFKYLFFSLLLAACYYIAISLLFSTEQERRLRRENRAMAKEYKLLEEKLDVLDNTISNLRVKDRDIYRLVFNSEPPAFSLSGSGGFDIGGIENLDNDRLVAGSAQTLSALLDEAEEADKSIASIYESTGYLGADLAHIPTIVPLKGFLVSQSGASLGRKVNPFYKTVVMHDGMDLVASVGTEVVATANGRVSLTRRSSRESGNSVEIDHGNGYKTVYSHLGDILVRNGMVVERGETIARVGNSGMSFAPHLHYKVVLRGKEVDPLNYFFASLSMEQYKEMLLISSNTGQSLD